MNVQIEILNPEVKGILDQLVKLNLIRITSQDESKLFAELLKRIRENTEEEISLEEISEEVESVRSQRFGGHRKSD